MRISSLPHLSGSNNKIKIRLIVVFPILSYSVENFSFSTDLIPTLIFVYNRLSVYFSPMMSTFPTEMEICTKEKDLVLQTGKFTILD